MTKRLPLVGRSIVLLTLTLFAHGAIVDAQSVASGTFPLSFVEVVWGDGKKIDRQVISATDLPPLGAKRFAIPFDLAGKAWVRFAVWDSAGNGAFVQPVWLAAPIKPTTALR